MRRLRARTRRVSPCALHGIEPSLAQVLNEVLLARLKESGVFSSVIGGSDIAAMVTWSSKRRWVGRPVPRRLGGAGRAVFDGLEFIKVGGQFVLRSRCSGRGGLGQGAQGRHGQTGGADRKLG